MEQCGAKTWLQLAWWSPSVCSHCRPPPFKKLLLITTRVSLTLSLSLYLGAFKVITFMHWFCVYLNFINYSAVGFVSICILCVSMASISFIFWFKCSYFCINLNFINYPAVGFVSICILHVNKASIYFLCSFRCFCNRGNREVVKMGTGGF